MLKVRLVIQPPLLTNEIGGFGESNSGVCKIAERYERSLNA